MEDAHAMASRIIRARMISPYGTRTTVPYTQGGEAAGGDTGTYCTVPRVASQYRRTLAAACTVRYSTRVATVRRGIFRGSITE